ncbi:MAG TPA: substrate-binding domain-containing protein, partial [Propionibacteriaceae bacterium]|nr:substrate-binding domain-containing protein [Propionibacteriaceae bacterium]
MLIRLASRSLLAGAVLFVWPLAAVAAPAMPALSDGGPIAVITVDPSNPYWKAEIDTASAEFEKLGYQPTTSAHENDPDTQNQLIETAINDKVKGVLLDPAGADESVAAVQKLVDANIPVVLINAEIS